MRDPNRIEIFLEKLEKLWMKYPDLRFGQLISLITNEIKMPNLLLVEDEQWKEAVQRVINKTDKKENK